MGEHFAVKKEEIVDLTFDDEIFIETHKHEINAEFGPGYFLSSEINQQWPPQANQGYEINPQWPQQANQGYAINQQWPQLANQGYEINQQWPQQANQGYEINPQWPQQANQGYENNQQWPPQVPITPPYQVPVRKPHEQPSAVSIGSSSGTPQGPGLRAGRSSRTRLRPLLPKMRKRAAQPDPEPRPQLGFSYNVSSIFPLGNNQSNFVGGTVGNEHVNSLISLVYNVPHTIEGSMTRGNINNDISFNVGKLPENDAEMCSYCLNIVKDINRLITLTDDHIKLHGKPEAAFALIPSKFKDASTQTPTIMDNKNPFSGAGSANKKIIQSLLSQSLDKTGPNQDKTVDIVFAEDYASAVSNTSAMPLCQDTTTPEKSNSKYNESGPMNDLLQDQYLRNSIKLSNIAPQSSSEPNIATTPNSSWINPPLTVTSLPPSWPGGGLLTENRVVSAACTPSAMPQQKEDRIGACSTGNNSSAIHGVSGSRTWLNPFTGILETTDSLAPRENKTESIVRDDGLGLVESGDLEINRENLARSPSPGILVINDKVVSTRSTFDIVPSTLPNSAMEAIPQDVQLFAPIITKTVSLAIVDRPNKTNSVNSADRNSGVLCNQSGDQDNSADSSKNDVTPSTGAIFTESAVKDVPRISKKKRKYNKNYEFVDCSQNLGETVNQGNIYQSVLNNNTDSSFVSSDSSMMDNFEESTKPANGNPGRIPKNNNYKFTKQTRESLSSTKHLVEIKGFGHKSNNTTENEEREEASQKLKRTMEPLTAETAKKPRIEKASTPGERLKKMIVDGCIDLVRFDRSISEFIRSFNPYVRLERLKDLPIENEYFSTPDNFLRCHECRLNFENRLSLHMHYIETKKYICVKCKKRFDHENQLKVHLSSSERLYFCVPCRVELRHFSQLELHDRGIHDLLCCLCDNRYLTLPALNQHLLQHHEFESKCKICNFPFVVGDAWKHVHINTHVYGVFMLTSDENEISPVGKEQSPINEILSCAKCKKVFSDQDALLKHLIEDEKAFETEENANNLTEDEKLFVTEVNANQLNDVLKNEENFNFSVENVSQLSNPETRDTNPNEDVLQLSVTEDNVFELSNQETRNTTVTTGSAPSLLLQHLNEDEKELETEVNSNNENPYDVSDTRNRGTTQSLENGELRNAEATDTTVPTESGPDSLQKLIKVIGIVEENSRNETSSINDNTNSRNEGIITNCVENNSIPRNPVTVGISEPEYEQEREIEPNYIDNRIFSCAKCSKVFDNEYLLLTHLFVDEKVTISTDAYSFMHHTGPGDEPILICAICNFVQESFDILLKHLIEHEKVLIKVNTNKNEDDDDDDDGGKLVIDEPENRGGLSILCVKCKETYHKKSTLLNHLIWHRTVFIRTRIQVEDTTRKVVENMTKNTIPCTQIFNDLDSDEELDVLHCKKCKKSVKTKDFFIKDIPIEHFVVCEICKRSLQLKTRGTLYKHLLDHHKHRYNCLICNGKISKLKKAHFRQHVFYEKT